MKIKCRQHPKYFGKGQPTSNCKKCWEIWNRKNGKRFANTTIEDDAYDGFEDDFEYDERPRRKQKKYRKQRRQFAY